MKFIIKLFPEITIKSQSVRLRFIKILTGNIRNVLKHYDETLAVVRHWDNIEVRAKDENQRLAIRDALTRIPGIHHILEVEDVPFTDMHDIFEKALVQYRDQLEGKTFCVRVKRRGKHDFSSIDVERYVGGGLNQHIESARVKLTNPAFKAATDGKQVAVLVPTTILALQHYRSFSERLRDAARSAIVSNSPRSRSSPSTTPLPTTAK